MTTRDLPLSLLSAQTPKGNVWHLVDLDRPEATRGATLCGRNTGVNPRYIVLGADHLGPSERATCTRCLRLAETLDDDPIERLRVERDRTWAAVRAHPHTTRWALTRFESADDEYRAACRASGTPYVSFD